MNYPFDSAYLPLYQAIVFTVMALGYQIRMALEVENSGLSRLAKIVDIIRETPYGIHDISRAGADEDTGLARFNGARPGLGALPALSKGPRTVVS